MSLKGDIEIYLECRGECESCTRCVRGMCPIKSNITLVKRGAEKLEESMRKKWTAAEEQELIKLVKQGYDNTSIAERFGVTAVAVQGKKNKLRASGLLDKTDRRGRPPKTEIKEDNKMEQEATITRDVKRGQIYHVKYAGDTMGSEQRAGRPAIIVGNDIGNRYSKNVEIVYMTTKEKAPMPTHVRITSAPETSTALCESVTTISKERLGDFYCEISDSEQKEIDRALLVSFGLTMPETEEAVTADTSVCDSHAEIERDVYRGLYMELINRFLPKEKPAKVAD